jgi:hypothetical protein
LVDEGKWKEGRWCLPLIARSIWLI